MGFLVQVGKRDENGDVAVLVQLPGVKQARGERPHDAIWRLLGGLEELVQDVKLLKAESDVLRKDSPTYSICTRYMRTKYAAILGKVMPEPCMLPALHKVSCTGIAAIPGADEWVARDFASRNVYMVTTGPCQGN